MVTELVCLFVKHFAGYEVGVSTEDKAGKSVALVISVAS
jgi:hypothetical protein